MTHSLFILHKVIMRCFIITPFRNTLILEGVEGSISEIEAVSSEVGFFC